MRASTYATVIGLATGAANAHANRFADFSSSAE
jgi:hypothetical protein